MGLIKAGVGSLGGVMADQWKEFFYCDALGQNILAKRGQKQVSGRSSNTKGHDNIITNGSLIAVADGQCMLIVEQGKIVEVCAEPGQFVYNSSTEPSVFAGSLGESIVETFKTIGKRFTFGGDTAKDQRIYFINTKELLDNKFGTPNPILFRIVDHKLGLDMDTSLRCSGVYSYYIENPLLFYTGVCGNVAEEYRRETLDEQLKTEFISALSPALGRLSELELRPNQIPTHTAEIEKALNEVLSEKWLKLRGLKVLSVAMNPVVIPEEDAEILKQAQRAAVLQNPAMAAGTIAAAQADAMRTAAGNTGGAMAGFMGMGMAANAGGNLQGLFTQAQQVQQQQQAQQPKPTAAENGWKCSCGAVNEGNFCSRCGAKKPEPKAAAGTWKCSCGAENTGKFCVECGSPKPQEDGWKCSCGAVNKGKFCPECGAKKPAGAPLYRCDKCGWEPEDPMNPPKFCPECGDAFDENDVK